MTHPPKIRRILSIALAGVLGFAGLTACSAGGGSDSASSSTLDVWGWVPGLEDLVDEWNGDHADVQVKFHRMTGDDGIKVAAAVDAGSGPDLVQLSTHSIPEYVIADRIQDITQYVGDTEDDYTASSWASVSLDGKVYGVPQDIGPAGMMYREDIFAKYGVAVPTTWDEYLDAARAIHAADPNVYISNLSPTESGQWNQEVQQAEGTWYQIDGDTWKVSVNGAESKLVADRWQTLLDEGLVTTQQMWTPEYWSLVNSGTVAAISYAAWFPVLLAENAADTTGLWRVAPLPVNEGSTNSADSGGGAFVVLKGAKNPKAAAEFASWVNSSPDTQETLITTGGLFPSSNAGLASPALESPSAFYGDQVVNEVFIKSAADAPATWVDGPNFTFVQAAIGDEFSKVITGEQTFSEALDVVQAATVADLTQRGLNVSE